MNLLKASTALLVACSMTSTAMAAAPKNCVTEAESAAIFAALLPDIIDSLRDKCAAHLPADAFLVRRGDDLIARYKVLADQRWATAKLAFGRMAGEEELTGKMPDDLLRPLIGSVVGAELMGDFKAKDCLGAARVVESLAPLPPENVSVLIGAIMTLAADEKDQDDSMPICQLAAR